MRWNLLVVFICVCLMPSDPELLLGYLYFIFWKLCISCSLTFFLNEWFVFCRVTWVSYVFRVLILYWVHNSHFFSHFVVVLHFVDYFLCCAKKLLASYNPFVFFCLYCLCFCDLTQEEFACASVSQGFSYVFL